MRFFLRKKSRVVVWVLVLVLAIVLLNVFQKEVRSFFYWFSAPIQKVLFRAGEGTANFLAGVFRAGDIKKELDEVKLKNQELFAKIIVLENLEEENKILREALGIGLQKEFKLALAQIINKDISQDFILIDKGSKDGILEKMPVVNQQKALVGRISEVYKNFSKVMLISNKKSSFNALVQKGEKDISGVIKGKGNLRILFDLVPREENLSQNDIIVTSVLGGVFPKGLLVGKIKKINKSDLEPFQQAEIEPAFNISRLEKVFIILEF